MITNGNGVPNMSGIYIPEAWSGKLLVKFYASTIFGTIANTDYEGEIKGQADKVIIRTTPNLEIRDYTIGTPLNVQRPVPGKIELTIDKAKYWNFIADDVQEMQSDIAYVEKWTEDASEQLKQVVDRDILSNIYVDPVAANKGATAGAESGGINLGTTGAPVQLTVSNVVDYIIDCNTVLDEQNIPETERFMVLPAWAVNRIKRSDLQNAMLTGDSKSPLRTGLVGRIDRTDIYSSNNLTAVMDGATKCWNPIFGQKSALTFASQLVKNESLKAESTFGTLYRGLQVFGYKTVKPEALGAGYIKR